MDYDKIAEVVGNGIIDWSEEHDHQRSNARTLDWSGNAWFAGDVYVGGTGQDDASAKRLAKEDTWELIYETTLDADATALTIDTDLTGGAFRLKQFIYTTYTPKGTTNSTIAHTMRFNDGTSTRHNIGDAVKTTTQTTTGFIFNGVILTRINSAQALVISQPPSKYFFYQNKELVSITLDNVIPSGTEIKLYGIRA